MRPPMPPRVPPASGTVHPNLLRKQALLQRAQQAAQKHVEGIDGNGENVISGDWRTFFDERKHVDVPERQASFHVYTAGSSGPVIFCVHGGGYTGLSFSLVASSLKAGYRVVAMDLRGHGETTTANDADLSKDTLMEDILVLWEVMFGEEKPPTVLMGHSVGGAMTVWAALSDRISTLEGLVVIDVVEGTAISSLPHMTSILAKRPASFKTTDEAVEWALENNMSRCRRAAVISLPSQLKQKDDAWVWRTPLKESQPFWEEWYLGLSQAFLDVKCPKVLLLAGADRLDRILTIGQMQGRFQMVLMPNAGHAVHEDASSETSTTVSSFMKRFRIGEPPMVFPKHALGLPPVLPQAAGVEHAAVSQTRIPPTG